MIRFLFTFFTLASLFLHANERHQMNFYNNLSEAGYTPGLSYLYLFGKNFGFELGGNYALGAETVNVSYQSFSANLLLTYRISTAKKQTLMLKAGGSYREYITTYEFLSSTVVDREINYYNFGFDYLYDIKDFGKFGFSYFADSFGLVYRIAF